ncbi:Probable G-protein coupled receptor CG31760 [Eumeta japonica]|uniref:Probable G-protein coupled receptor CG31760 n=1 Tax=Eumeta variegata TaxID=151549 RepID=A0A4C1Y1P3_EUMVA|nr:Probable G-protein coupled receptor CG31760 [Eumeta japonica]
MSKPLDEWEKFWADEQVESSLRLVHAVATGATGALCVTHHYGRLRAPLSPVRWDAARARADLAAWLLHYLGLENSEYLISVSEGLVMGASPKERAVGARALALRPDGTVNGAVAWQRLGAGEPVAVMSPKMDEPPDPEYPWYVSAQESESLRSPKFMPSELGATLAGWWSYPYYSCNAKRWLLSYTVPVATVRGLKGIISLDVDISGLEINQCDVTEEADNENQIYSFHGTHKCPNETTYCEYKPIRQMGIKHAGWSRGSYICRCRQGYYSTHHPEGFNGSLVEIAFQESQEGGLENWSEPYECQKCQPGCDTCPGPRTLPRHIQLAISMAAIFPVLDRYSCIATKWTRHMGFCITYTALLMKTWRVSLTYRVKSAHKLKLTDKQLLQWMAPILLIMLVYLGTWTLSAPPDAEDITDNRGLRFKQCTYNWWDHSLAIGEILFLLWGVRVCYRVRHAESLYNEARLISIAIYNIFTVNSLMIAFQSRKKAIFDQCMLAAMMRDVKHGPLCSSHKLRTIQGALERVMSVVFLSNDIGNEKIRNKTKLTHLAENHLLILPRAGPDIKYLLGFIRTQLSTSTTVILVFAPKVLRVLRGTGDTWDSRARARGVTASSSLNGIGLVADDPPDLYQENEELKEEVQKLAAQIEFMKIVQMEMHNRHLRPRPGSYFSNASVPLAPNSAAPPALQSPHRNTNANVI